MCYGSGLKQAKVCYKSTEIRDRREHIWNTKNSEYIGVPTRYSENLYEVLKDIKLKQTKVCLVSLRSYLKGWKEKL